MFASGRNTSSGISILESTGQNLDFAKNDFLRMEGINPSSIQSDEEGGSSDSFDADEKDEFEKTCLPTTECDFEKNRSFESSNHSMSEHEYVASSDEEDHDVPNELVHLVKSSYRHYFENTHKVTTNMFWRRGTHGAT